MKTTFSVVLCGALLIPLLSPARAQDEAPKTAPPAAKPNVKPDAKIDPQAAEKAKLELVQAGELRLDGKITAILGEGVWQMEAVSWTSPRGVSTNFDEPKSKGITVAATANIHERGQIEAVPLREVKIAARVAIIGKNAPDGTLIAREVVLLDKLNVRTIGSVRTNPFTSVLLRQSREARAAGQLPKALQLIEKAIATARGQGDLGGEGLATQDKVIILAGMEQRKEALDASNRVIAIGRQLGNPLILSLGLDGAASMLNFSGQTEKALTLLKEADTASAPLEPSLHLEILADLARTYLVAGQLQNGIATFNRLAPLEDAAGKPSDAGETLLQVAALTAVERPTAARQTLTDVQGRIDRARDEKAKAGLVGTSALVRWRLGEKDAARTGFSEAATLLQAAGASAEARRWEGMAARLEAADENWQSFFLAASGIKRDVPGTPTPPAENGPADGAPGDNPPV